MRAPGRTTFSRLASLCLVCSLLAGVFAPGVAGAQQPQGYPAYERARSLYEANDLQGSLLELKDSLTQSPNLLPAHILLARIYLAVGQGAAAEAALDKIRRFNPDPAITEPLYTEAMLAQFEFGQIIARRIPEGLPDSVLAQLAVTRALAYLELGDERLADESLDRALALHAESVPALAARVKVAIRRGNLDDAVRQAVALVETAPESPSALYSAGNAHHARGNLGEAMALYDRTLEALGSHYDARIARAGVLLDNRSYDRVKADLEYLREQFPEDPRVAYLESVVLARTGAPNESRAALQRAGGFIDGMQPQAIARSPQYQLLAGIVNFELRRFEQAEGHLVRYIERQPRQAGPRKMFGSMLLELNRIDEALSTLQVAATISPGDPQLLAMLSEAYKRNGRHELATEYLERAVAASGGDPRLRTQLAMSRLAEGATAAGLGELDELFSADPDGNFDAGFQLAVAYLKANRPAEARRVAEALADVRPNDLTVVNLLASSTFAAGERDKARLIYQWILERDPGFGPAEVNLAKLESSAGGVERARERLMDALGERPDSVRTMIELSRLEERAGDADAALAWAVKARDKDPENISGLLALGELYLRRGEPRDALETVQAAEAISADAPRVLELLARAHLASGSEDIAASIYARLASAAGFDPDELARVARLQLAIGAGDDALYSLRKALSSDAGHREALQLQVEAELLHGDTELALRLADSLRAADASDADAHRLHGDALATRGDYAGATVSYREALRLAPSTAAVLALYRASMRSGDVEGGRAVLSEWLGRRPQDFAARMALAENRLIGRDLEAARRALDTAILNRPASAEAHNLLAYVLDRLGEPGAIDAARRARELAPDDPTISDTLGWLLVKDGQPMEGLRFLRDAESRAFGNREVLYHIGAALLALDRRDEARRALEGAVADGPGYEGLGRARELLDSLGGARDGGGQ